MEKQWEDALWGGDVEWARHLIENGIDINSKDCYGQTGLMVASLKGYADLARLLIERGADMNVAAKYNLTALMLAVINNHIEIVHLLADAGADRRVRGTGSPGFADKTALDLAVKSGREEMAAVLRDPVE